MFLEQTVVLLSLCAHVSCMAAGNSLSVSAWRLLWSKKWKKKKNLPKRSALTFRFFSFFAAAMFMSTSLDAKRMSANITVVQAQRTIVPGGWLLFFCHWIYLNSIKRIIPSFFSFFFCLVEKSRCKQAKQVHVQCEEHLPIVQLSL